MPMIRIRWDIPAHALFEHRLAGVQAVIQNQDNREHDLLDSDDYYQFQGGMSNAIRVLSGTAPACLSRRSFQPRPT